MCDQNSSTLSTQQVNSAKPLGGFFELELPTGSRSCHANAIALSTGRACLRALLNYVRPQKCYVPFYTCDATLDPFRELDVQTSFYEINDDLEPVQLPSLGEREFFLYTNYFGIKRLAVTPLLKNFGRQLIVDNTHDFFYRGEQWDTWSFTSARKHFGVPDGAFLYCPTDISMEDVVAADTPRFRDISIEHSWKRQTGNQEEAFRLYQAYEQSLTSDLYRISLYSEFVLSHLDFESVQRQRRQNFDVLHDALSADNQLSIQLDETIAPFAYPFLPSPPLRHSDFHEQNIFVPVLWPDVSTRDAECQQFNASRRLASQVLPFPIDHRYTSSDMNRISRFTRAIINNGK